jgi:hypothetical protein
VAQGLDPSAERSDAGEDPFQRQILRDQLDRVAEEKRLALLDPGPTWHEWFFHSAAKWWIGLAFLVVDAWLIVACLDIGLYLLTIPVLVVALYIEFLVYRYLWYSPDTTRSGGRFRRSWVRPVPFGRWTSEAEHARTHPTSSDGGPEPNEFL